MANTQRIVVTLPIPLYHRAKRYAKEGHTNNMSQLVRVAMAEYFDRHYDDGATADLDWGGWRDREKKPEKAAAK